MKPMYEPESVDELDQKRTEVLRSFHAMPTAIVLSATLIGTCDSCKHWSPPPDSSGLGDCEYGNSSGEGPPDTPPATFGCNWWEAAK